MSSQPMETESFEAFKNSFFYGARNDLNFKFLKNLSGAEAAEFFQGLLRTVAEWADGAEDERLLQYVCDWQARGYAAAPQYHYSEGPFCRPRKPLSRCRLALLTSSGHFVRGRDPEPFGVKGMSQEQAMARIGEFLRVAPELSAIPVDTPVEALQVRHGGYDVRGAQADPNVVFPLQRLVELQAEGVFGELAPEAYSFVGAAAQTRLLKETGPQWVERLREQAVDVALLVPV